MPQSTGKSMGPGSWGYHPGTGRFTLNVRQKLTANVWDGEIPRPTPQDTGMPGCKGWGQGMRMEIKFSSGFADQLSIVNLKFSTSKIIISQ